MPELATGHMAGAAPLAEGTAATDSSTTAITATTVEGVVEVVEVVEAVIIAALGHVSRLGELRVKG